MTSAQLRCHASVAHNQILNGASVISSFTVASSADCRFAPTADNGGAQGWPILRLGVTIAGSTVTRMLPGVTLASQPAMTFTTWPASGTHSLPWLFVSARHSSLARA